MNRGLVLSCAAALWLAGCGDVPYRTAGYSANPDCQTLYDKYDDVSEMNKDISDEVRRNPCWLRAREERDNYDLLFLEFDDQGWVQGSSSLDRPGKKDALDEFFAELGDIYQANQKNGLSLVVFVHGWHHNASASDDNVTGFRRLVRDLAIAETGRKLTDRASGERRVVGIYLGWRGESIPSDLLNWMTFWDRKNTAERVAQGSVREFFMRLDFLRDRGRTNLKYGELGDKDRPNQGDKNVRMLTIGHSFGGLIAFEALSGEFVRFAARSTGDDYVSRLGDLVVIVNPAVEGARYEPLMVAGQRLRGAKKDQLPVAIVATSTADWATGVAFPIARAVNTLLESTPGPEGDAIVKAVGHNDRYTTHRLAVCDKENLACASACAAPRTATRGPGAASRAAPDRAGIAAEYERMQAIGKSGFKEKEYLCSRLQLESTRKQFPKENPFWVVSTTGEIMDGHNDIFNPNFVSFIRQMYLGVISVRNLKE
jgi:pimeloyl-ACP methyl ester carboxylesterase